MKSDESDIARARTHYLAAERLADRRGIEALMLGTPEAYARAGRAEAIAHNAGLALDAAYRRAAEAGRAR